MRKICLLIAFCVVVNSVIAQPVSSRYAGIITPQPLREKLSFIAGKATEGRETASPGQRLAASYIESKFKAAGLLPGTPGGYQMVFPVYQDTLMDASFSVNKKKFQYGQDYSVNISTLQSHYSNINEIVFAGYGVVDSSRNDYKGLDVRGKWLMVLDGKPGMLADASTRRKRAVASAKIDTAISRGVKGLIIVSRSFPTNELVAQSIKYVKKVSAIPSMYVSVAVASAILSKNVTFEELEQTAVGPYKTTVETYAYKRTKTLPSTNVLGIMPGTDKKDEYVFITAHYDHLGKKDSIIYYGADDDGSGTTSIIQMAETFAQAKADGHAPRRSIVFMAVSAEEMGKLGSEFYTDHPIYPLAQTSVDLNIDMVGRSDPKYTGDSLNYLYIIGDDRLSSELRPLTDSANQLVKLELDRRFNGNDPERFYFRSDHYNFAKNGVPIIFYFNGTHADYHRATDTVDKIKFDLMARRVQLVFNTAWMMVNREAMLKRNIPLE
jgi:hypothetical protein